MPNNRQIIASSLITDNSNIEARFKNKPITVTIKNVETVVATYNHECNVDYHILLTTRSLFPGVWDGRIYNGKVLLENGKQYTAKRIGETSIQYQTWEITIPAASFDTDITIEGLFI